MQRTQSHFSSPHRPYEEAGITQSEQTEQSERITGPWRTPWIEDGGRCSQCIRYEVPLSVHDMTMIAH